MTYKSHEKSQTNADIIFGNVSWLK